MRSQSKHTQRVRGGSRRGFSLIEVLIALTITSTLLTATMAALDASFKGYKVTSESASTNVIARIVMQRLTSMIRTGEDFGPYPVNPLLDPEIVSDHMEFVSFRDPVSNIHRVTRLERRDGNAETGPFELWYVVTEFEGDERSSRTEALLLSKLNKVEFAMTYDVGPKLERVTIDLIMQPDDVDDAAISAKLDAPTIRLVASASPRQFDE